MVDVYIVPPNTKKQDLLFVWLSEDKNGNEGVISIELMGVQFPCVLGNEKTALAIAPKVQQVGAVTGMAVKLVTFERAQELARYNPR